MGALAHIDETQLPVGARKLGVRVKPILRLAMGHKDDRGYPVKDDHFSPRGDDRAVAKFEAEYGGNPKAIEILLPTELDVALSIQYRAFKGAAGGEGGTLVAIGQTNFALHDHCGGYDVITVFNQDGSVEEIETGLDADTREPLDDRAKELGLEMYTTLTAMMPGVLGFGSYFALTTKGKESTDNLWAKSRQLYELFGSKVTFAVKPQLVIKPSTARPVVKKDGETKRISTKIFVADIVVPETIDEMIGRLQQRQSALAPAGAAAALYGDRELSPGVAPSDDAVAGPGRAGDDGDGRAGRGGDVEPAAAAELEAEEGVWEEIPAPSEAEIKKAAAITVPSGNYMGKTLAQVAEDGEAGVLWLQMQLRKPSPPRPAAIETFVRGRLPEAWAAHQAWLEEQS
jgi:hypothetical protein